MITQTDIGKIPADSDVEITFKATDSTDFTVYDDIVFTLYGFGVEKIIKLNDGVDVVDAKNVTLHIERETASGLEGKYTLELGGEANDKMSPIKYFIVTFVKSRTAQSLEAS